MYFGSTLESVSSLPYRLDEDNFIEKEIVFDLPHHHLTDLFPYDLDKKNKANLQIGLKEYQMLLNVCFEVINALQKGDLRKFDSLVGENACEIRAVWIAIIASKDVLNLDDLKTRIFYIQQQIDVFLMPKKIAHLMQNGISLKQLFLNENLFVSLNFDMMFLIQSFLLTEVKVIVPDDALILSLCIRDKCDPKKLKKFGDISSSFADNLVKKLRKWVAMASVRFVREKAFMLQNKFLIKMLSEDFTFHHNTCLPCTPMFWTYKTILSSAQAEGIPLIICAKFLEKTGDGYKVIESDWLFFEPEPTDNNKSYKNLTQKKLVKADGSRAAWVIQGVVCPQENVPLLKTHWRKSMSMHSIHDIVLAGAADHRQYPDPKQDDVISLCEDHEYETYKSFAKEKGFSLENPKTFFIQHVYPSRIGAVLPMLNT